MKLSKEYLMDRLQSTSVHDLAVEITDQMASEYQGTAIIQRSATIAKFEKMLAPLALKVQATDLMRSMGVQVTEVR